MANEAHQIMPILNMKAWVQRDRYGTSSYTPANGADGITTEANYTASDTIDARLNTINSTSYSASRLLSMTMNDKLYALRLNDDEGGI